MHKRQDAAVFHPTAKKMLALFSFFFILITAACSSSNYQNVKDPPPSPTTAEKPTSTPNELPVPEKTSPNPAATTSTRDCHSSGGEIQNSSFESELLGTHFEYKIYLPPCYPNDTEEDYPVAFLLHGLSYTNNQWLRIGLVEAMDALIADGLIAPYIVVLPYETKAEPPQTSRFPDALSLELLPWVDAHYRTLSDKPYRAIGGVSRGAAWAVQIGFEHRDLFSAIGAHSLPLFQADEANITFWLNQEPLEDQPRVFIDIGRNDQEWKTAQDFADLLDANHIPHEWYMFKNGHTESYWSSHIEQYLAWYAQDW